MQLHELIQIFPNIASAVGASDRTGLFLVHQNTAAGAEPSPSEGIAFSCEVELFRLLRFGYKKEHSPSDMCCDNSIWPRSQMKTPRCSFRTSPHFGQYIAEVYRQQFPESTHLHQAYNHPGAK
jgi:hypothetical protein